MAADPPLHLRLPDPPPQQRSPPCATNEKAIVEWLSDLPLADPMASAGQVIAALADFDQQQLKAGDRLKVLRTFLPSVNDIADTLRHRIRNHALPLSEHGNEIASRIRDLHRQCAVGFKRTVVEHDKAGLMGSLSRKDLLGALQGGMVYLAEELFDSFQVYQQPAPGIWADLHQLYLYAESNQLLETPLSPMSTPAGAETSLKRHYLRLLMLSLASPYRMRQGEVEWVYRGLQRWISYCTISVPPTHESGLGVLTIDMLADEPADQPLPGQAIGPERYRILTTIDLLPILRRELTEVHEQGRNEPISDGGAVSPDIYKRLTQAWSTAPQRSFSRSERTNELQVTVSLISIHRFIAQGGAASGAASPDLELVPEDHPRATGEYVIEDRPGDIWSLAYKSDASIPDRDHPQAAEAHRCGTINESAGGYCLTTHRESDLRARVGELIGVHNEGANRPWEIGVIRWLRGGEDDWMEFGVQMIAPYAHAAYISLPETHEASERRPVLLLPEVRAMRQPVSLVTEPSTYPAGLKIILATAKGEVNVTLVRLLEATGSYSLYQFSSEPGVLDWLDP